MAVMGWAEVVCSYIEVGVLGLMVRIVWSSREGILRM